MINTLNYTVISSFKKPEKHCTEQKFTIRFL